jgi:RecB family endonuclease NucS
MPRRVLVRSPTSAFNLLEVPTANEHDLQEVVKANPQLLPAQDLGLDGDLLVVGRETTLASGSIDLLCLSRTGELVLVEFKTGPQNPDFRHALGDR